MGDTLKWRMLTAGFGIEVDYDLSKPMSPALQDDLRALFAEHNIVVFRKQTITKEDQVRVMSHLGPPLDDVRDFGLVSNTRKDGAFGITALEFHSDNIFMAEPILGVSLYALDVVDGASSTNFANTRRAYGKLPDSLRARLQDLEAVQILGYHLTERNTAATVPQDDRRPWTARPVVIKHRTTDVPMLCLCRMNTDHIVGLPHQESEAIINEVFSYLYAPDNVYEHKWHNGDIVIWDNLAMQHARGPVKDVGRRTLQRVAMGPKGFNEQSFADIPREQEIYIQS